MHKNENSGNGQNTALLDEMIDAVKNDLPSEDQWKRAWGNLEARLDAQEGIAPLEARRFPRTTRGRLAWAAGAVIFIAVGLFFAHTLRPADDDGSDTAAIPAFSLLVQAAAAEETLFSADAIVHIVNEIIVRPVSNPAFAKARWIPITSLEAEGAFRFHQLELPGEPGKGYTVKDESWYDPGTGKFARIMKARGKPVFATSYDGAFVCSLERTDDGSAHVAKQRITPGFKRPKNPAGFLGLAAGFVARLEELDKGAVQHAGHGTLADGSAVQVLKAGMPAPDGTMDSYWLFRIRRDDHAMAEMEFFLGGESALLLRRAGRDIVAAPGVSWTLDGIAPSPAEDRDLPTPEVVKDMVVPDVSVRHLVETASFDTYIFAKSPPWATKREIDDVLDLVSKPHRMFVTCYVATDTRHVVMIQALTFQKMFAPMAENGTLRLVYTSPSGFKALTGGPEWNKWGANIALRSARHVIKDPPSENRTSYILESPSGVHFPVAINGPLTDEELHALVDSLVLAEKHKDD